MKRIMAVYDVDPFYAERLAEFANQKEKTPFTVVAFTSLTRLKQFAEEQSVELLLAGDGVPEECLKELDIRQVMRLGEVKDMTAPDVPVIYKYQSSDAVLREVMACYQVQPEQMPLMAVGIRSTIIGICSPVGRCGKTGFGFTLGQIMARDSKVLFLGLEEYSALSRLTQTQYAATLTDLVYYYQSGEYNRMRLASVVYSWNGMDYIPPVSYAEDLAELDGEEFAGLIRRIAAEGIYDAVILDLGHLVRKLEPVLEQCDMIYAPIREDCVSAAKVDAWHSYILHSGREELWERIRLLKLPVPSTVRPAESYLEQLLWGEVGDFCRSLLKGTKGGGYEH